MLWVSPRGEACIWLNGFILSFWPAFNWECGVHASGMSLIRALGSDVSLEQQNSRVGWGQPPLDMYTLTKVLQRNLRNRLDGTKGSCWLFPQP